MENNYGHWNISEVIPFNPDEWFGFIYLIKNKITEQSYIGKKFFKSKKSFQKNNKKKSKKVDSNWKEYTSSSECLNEDIQKLGKENFDFVILKLCSGKAELSYLEEYYHYTFNVLYEKLPDNSRAFYNKTIGYRHFNGVEKQSEETKRKISESKIGTIQSIESNLKRSNTLKGRPSPNKGKRASPETLLKQSLASKGENNGMFGKKHSKEALERMSQIKKGKIPGNTKKWIIIFPDGHQEIIFNLKNFCKENNLCDGHMNYVAKGINKQHKGFKCKNLNGHID